MCLAFTSLMTFSSITETRGFSVDLYLPSVCNISDPKVPVGCKETELSEQLKKSITDFKNFMAGSIQYRCNEWLQDDAAYTTFLKDQIDLPIEQTTWGSKFSLGNQSWRCDVRRELNKFFSPTLPHFDSSKSEEILKSFKQTFPSEYHPAADLFVSNCLTQAGRCGNYYTEFLYQIYKFWMPDPIAIQTMALDLLTKILNAAISVRAQIKIDETQLKIDKTQLILKAGGCVYLGTGETYTNGSKAFGKECQNGAWITRYTTTSSSVKPNTNSTSNSSSKSCRDPILGIIVASGRSLKFSDGVRTCKNGRWSEPSKSSGSSSSKTLKGQVCDLRAGAMTSSWKGQSYSWTIWNIWSDGTKSIASSGSGYEDSVPYGC